MPIVADTKNSGTTGFFLFLIYAEFMYFPSFPGTFKVESFWNDIF